jgi:hypothetical protein
MIGEGKKLLKYVNNYSSRSPTETKTFARKYNEAFLLDTQRIRVPLSAVLRL